MSSKSPAPYVSGPLILIGMIVLAALSRLLPHPPNFSPLEAVALFGGAYFVKRWMAFIVPMIALLVSDLALGVINGGIYVQYYFSISFVLVYACIALLTLMGLGLRGKVGVGRVAGFSVAGSLLFFLVTNFASWLGSPMYPQTAAGLSAAYVAGIPFLQNTVLGTLFYSGLLFGGFAYLRRQHPALRLQTA